MNYLEDIYKLSYVTRYSGIPRIREETVAEHCFYVSAIVLGLHDVYDFNLGTALQIAVSHDLPELELNDCPHPIKYKYIEIKKAYDMCEARVLRELPKSVQKGVKLYDAKSTVESWVVHYADILQCEHYAQLEVNMGNKGYFQDILDKSIERKLVYLDKLERYRYERS